MPAPRSINLESELPRYGIGKKGVQWFKTKATYAQIDYLDLIEPQGPLADRLVRPDGVVENQERPLLFFVDQGRLAVSPEEQQQQIHDLRRALACRGDRAYLAIIRPGTLTVIPVSLKDQTSEWRPFTVQGDTPEAITFFSRLALGTFEESPAGREVDYLFKEIFTLVDKTATSLAKLNIKRSDVISLVGRVLFFRFLRDRGIIKEINTKKIAPRAATLAHCFDDAENTAATCHWLDKTFNGDFLPLTDAGITEFFVTKGKATGQKLFHHLKAILKGEEATGGDEYQGRLNFDPPKFDWGHLDFAHIPVGLLSQVYEKLSWKWNRERSQKTSVHYTPRNIAATLVGEAFDNLKDAHAAKVLDPACGASVFLVLAFRRLYRELWKHTNERPGTAAIRSILENQIVGFDICDSALKLSALSLYLTAIELDPDPAPPEKLKFKALCEGKSAILFDWRKEDDKEKGPVVGSIGEHVGKRFDDRFDLILCNPPWTSIGKEYTSVSAELDRISQAIVTRLDPDIGKGYKNPDNLPDLPFIWRSTEWSKPGGRIAMALPARTLFKQGPKAETTRKALFSLLEVNGIINCSNLRKTQVWPDMDQPFMLLFARNQRPKSSHQLHFISPHTDLHANSLGEMRIDSKSAQLVDVEQTFAEPWLWKALAVGTALDLEVVRKIAKAEECSLQKFWNQKCGLVSSIGYSVDTDRVLRDSVVMKVLRNLTDPKAFRFVVDADQLPHFNFDEIARPRLDNRQYASDRLQVYRAPLVLIKASPGSDRSQGRALLSLVDLAYNECFFGYSTKGHPEAEGLARFLHLWSHSNLLMFFTLLTSSEIGIERPKLQKRDFDEFPFVIWERLRSADKHTVRELSSRLIQEDLTVFPEIDTFFGKLYGLSPSDVEVIKDTLEVREPNDELGRRASELPIKPERDIYFRRLESYLRPFFKALGKQPEIRPWKSSDDDLKSPFVVFTLTAKGAQVGEPTELFQSKVIPLANQTGSTQIIEEIEGGLLIAILRQYRYWTPSRARLLGAEILREHMTLFED